MKKIIVLFTVLIFGLNSCKKSDPEPIDYTSNIIGTYSILNIVVGTTKYEANSTTKVVVKKIGVNSVNIKAYATNNSGITSTLSDIDFNEITFDKDTDIYRCGKNGESNRFAFNNKYKQIQFTTLYQGTQLIYLNY